MRTLISTTTTRSLHTVSSWSNRHSSVPHFHPSPSLADDAHSAWSMNAAEEIHVHKSRDAATIGGIVAGVASAAMLVVIFYVLWRTRKTKTSLPPTRTYALMRQSNSTQTTYDGNGLGSVIHRPDGKHVQHEAGHASGCTSFVLQSLRKPWQDCIYTSQRFGDGCGRNINGANEPGRPFVSEYLSIYDHIFIKK